MNTPHYSIIMPVLNESATLGAALARLQPLRHAGAEIIVVDGGSTDETKALAHQGADGVISSPRGRGVQMNRGAEVARGALLIFLHADTYLPEEFSSIAHTIINQGAFWGRFDVHLSAQGLGYTMVALCINLRSRWSGIATGDQAMFVRRDVFERVGGFAPIPLMEDIDLSARLRALTRPLCLRQVVLTSARRWQKHGLWRTIVTMWWLRLRFFFGAQPEHLARAYGYLPQQPH